MRSIATLFALAWLAAPALAQDDVTLDDPLGVDEERAEEGIVDAHRGDPRMPQRIARRPITQPHDTLRVSLFASGAGVDTPFGEDFVLAFQLGGAYGVTDDLEVGVGAESAGIAALSAGPGARSAWRPTGEGLLSFLVLDEGLDFGDIPVYARYRFFRNRLVEIGGEAGVLVPTFSDFAIRLGVPVRLHLGDVFALDTGLYTSMTFGDDPARGGDDDFWGALFVPLRAVVSPADWFGFALTTGLHAGPFDGEFFAIPLGVELTASFVMGNESLLDFVAGFEWPALLRPTTDDADVVEVGTWVLSAGARFYFAVGD